MDKTRRNLILLVVAFVAVNGFIIAIPTFIPNGNGTTEALFQNPTSPPDAVDAILYTSSTSNGWYAMWAGKSFPQEKFLVKGDYIGTIWVTFVHVPDTSVNFAPPPSARVVVNSVILGTTSIQYYYGYRDAAGGWRLALHTTVNIKDPGFINSLLAMSR